MTSPHHELRGSTRPGRMTTAMRAGASAVPGRHRPKLLRIGVVQGGSVREERMIAASAHVSVGTNEQNTFLLGGATSPRSFRLFEHVGAAYHLNFTEETQGRVVLPSGIFELQDLKTEACAAGGVYRIALTEEARGRVVLGDVAFLFHFVAPPPLLPKAVLPSAVLRGTRRVDWNSTICTAASFFLHFMLLGAVYSDWADPVIDDDCSAAGLVDSLKSLPPPPPIEVKAPLDEPRADSEPSDSRPSARAPTKPASRPDPAPPPSHAGDAALSEQLAQLDAAIIGAFSNTKPATSGALRKSQVAWGALDSAARSEAGVGFGSTLDLRSAGAPIQPRGARDLRDIGTRTISGESRGRSVNVSGPRIDANVAPPSAIAGVVSDAARVVASLRAGFRACYERGLAENPDAGGAIRLTIRVGPAGEVSGVTASPSGNLPASVVSCVQRRARAAQFAAPEGGAAVILVPVTFVKQ